MDTLEFLQALYKDLPGGALSVTAKVGSDMLTKWFAPTQLEQMAALLKSAAQSITPILASVREKNLLGQTAVDRKKIPVGLSRFLRITISRGLHIRKPVFRNQGKNCLRS